MPSFPRLGTGPQLLRGPQLVPQRSIDVRSASATLPLGYGSVQVLVVFGAAMQAAAARLHRRLRLRRSRVAAAAAPANSGSLQGKSEAQADIEFRKKFQRPEFDPKSVLVRKLGKKVLPLEVDMRRNILEDPALSKRLNKTQEEVLADFDRSVEFLKKLGSTSEVADINVSRIWNGINLQHKGKPSILTNEHMNDVIEWVTVHVAVSNEDESLRKLLEHYPWMLSHTIEQLEEARTSCPDSVNFRLAAAVDPSMIDSLDSSRPGVLLD